MTSSTKPEVITYCTVIRGGPSHGHVQKIPLNFDIQSGPKKVIPLVQCNVMYERYHFWPTLYGFRGLWADRHVTNRQTGRQTDGQIMLQRYFMITPTDDLIKFWRSKVETQGHGRKLKWRRHPNRILYYILGRGSPCTRFLFLRNSMHLAYDFRTPTGRYSYWDHWWMDR